MTTAVDRRRALHDLQKALRDGLAGHMAAGPEGDPKWLAELNRFVRQDRDFRITHPEAACIWVNGICPPWSPVCCEFCARRGTWRWATEK